MSWIEEKFAQLRATYPKELNSSLVMPFLRIMLDEKKSLGESDAVFIANYLGLPAMQVKEALTWYTMFYRHPVGTHVIKVCRNIACSLMGAERIIDHLSRKLGIKPGETTADGRFTLLLVECLASCGTAPVMQIDDTYHEQLTEAKIDQILKGLS